jgi:hypothetical protein
VVADRILGLSVKQSWCSAIASGQKTVENRTWRTSYQPGGLLALHAYARVEWLAPDMAWIAAGVTPYRKGTRRADWTAALPLGCRARGSSQPVATSRGC